MILESMNRTLLSVSVMLFWRYSLKRDIVLGEGVLQILRTFVVEDVEIGRMSLLKQLDMCCLPSMTNAGSLSVRNCDGMNRVSIMMIENKKVVIAATGGDRKAARLIRLIFEKLLFAEEHGTKLMTFGFKRRGKIGISRDTG
jgi:hypothetical protein